MQTWRQERCFPANIVTFLKATFFIDHFQWTPHRTFLIQMPQGVLSKKILKNFERLTGKQLCQSLLFNKVAGLGPATLLKKRLRIGVFLKILKNTFFSPSTSSGCLHWLPKTESTGEFTKNFLWNQMSLICDNRFSQLLKVLLFATFNSRGI